ncbi:hypothetical protein [Aureimonas sp. ME7]|uniref:hypothetical protein n=1 Tax=Aureimonas sp. ME7 TaxID=2744252 RepID=UPI0015FE2EC6|nr:hypothetical protein [Aureimonas sp. ME7]
MGGAARIALAAAFLCVAALCAAISVANWNAAVAGRSLAALAGRIERRQPVSLASVENALPAISAQAAASSCNDRMNRAALTVSSVAQQAMNQAQSFEDWSAGLARTSGILRRGIACTPTNGNFWARLALTERAAAPTAVSISRFMAMSERLAPAEAGSLMARAEVWRTSPWLDGAAAEARARDLRTILARARAADAVRMLRQADPAIRDEVRAYLTDLPPKQAAELERIGLLEPRKGPAEYAPPREIFDNLFPRPPEETSPDLP